MKKEYPRWITSNGVIIPYGKTIIPKGMPFYGGGTQPRRARWNIKFPESKDNGERGFGVTQDYQDQTDQI